jgi:hypothetical protein
MYSTETGVGNLEAEYKRYIEQSTNQNRDIDLNKLMALLQADGNWTTAGAEALISLSRQYGTFMLRNALALACALNIEDGELGL